MRKPLCYIQYESPLQKKNTVLGPEVTHPAVLTQHPEGRWQEPVEELQQQRAVVWALQGLWKNVHPGDH